MSYLNLQGCHFGSKTQNVILPKLRASFEKAGLIEAGIGISASDETSIDVAYQSLCNYSPESLRCIDQINTHCVSPFPIFWYILATISRTVLELKILKANLFNKRKGSLNNDCLNCMSAVHR